jgi:hypothetical protein
MSIPSISLAALSTPNDLFIILRYIPLSYSFALSSCLDHEHHITTALRESAVSYALSSLLIDLPGHNVDEHHKNENRRSRGDTPEQEVGIQPNSYRLLLLDVCALDCQIHI